MTMHQQSLKDAKIQETGKSEASRNLEWRIVQPRSRLSQPVVSHRRERLLGHKAVKRDFLGVVHLIGGGMIL